MIRLVRGPRVLKFEYLLRIEPGPGAGVLQLAEFE